MKYNNNQKMYTVFFFAFEYNNYTIQNKFIYWHIATDKNNITQKIKF